jgi:hypothetical protein
MSGGNLRSTKLVLVAVVLMAFSAYLTLYTLRANTLAASYLYEDPDTGAISWRSGPSGSLFPWPRESGMFQVLSKVNEVDLFIYRYLIKTWALVELSTLMWVATAISLFKVAKTEQTMQG